MEGRTKPVGVPADGARGRRAPHLLLGPCGLEWLRFKIP